MISLGNCPIPLTVIAVLSTTVARVGLLAGSFLLLLTGAEVFTNDVEWLGHRLGVSESATGSILAAVGTALPETTIPTIAILKAEYGSGTAAAANEVGVGAILGAPFMLATIAMFLIGVSVLYFRDRRGFGAELHFNAEATRRDLSFFLVGYTLAFVAALVPNRRFAQGIALVLVGLYVTYVYRSLKSGELIEEGGLDDLHLGRAVEGTVEPVSFVGNERGYASDPPTTMILVQGVVALAMIVGGADLFVTEVQWISTALLGVPAAVVALLLAPLATELPEKFNSVIWISRDKDTLALGNVTGAMAFQGTVPVVLGVLFTSWNLSLDWGTAGFLNALSAALAVAGGGVLYLRVRRVDADANMNPVPFLVGGALYALFILVLLYHVIAFDLAVSGGH